MKDVQAILPQVDRKTPVRINPLTDPDLLDSHALAQLLNRNEMTLFHWRKKGQGPKFTRYNNGFIRYHRADVEAWLAEHPTKRKLSPAISPIDADWCAGFQAGWTGKASTPPPGSDTLSFLAGWLEGDAKRTQFARSDAA